MSPDGVAAHPAPEALSSYDAAAGWTAVAIAFLLSIITALNRNLIVLLVEPIRHHFDVSDVEISLVIGAAFAVPYAVMSFPAGWAADRLNRRLILFYGLICVCLATIATGIARTFQLLFAARAFTGVTVAGFGPTVSSLLSDLFPRERLGAALSIANMGSKAGQGAALLVGGFLLAQVSPMADYQLPLIGELKGWQLIFLITAIPGLLIAPAIFTVTEPRLKGEAKVAPAHHATIADYFAFVYRRLGFFLPHHLAQVLIVTMSYGVVAWTPAFLMRVHHLSPELTGAWLGAAFLFGPLLGLPIHGAVADHLLRRGWKDVHLRYPLIMVCLGSPIGIAGYLVSTPEVAVTLVGAFVLITSFYMSLPLAAALSITPSLLRGKTAAMIGLIASAGAALGPMNVGIFTDGVFGRDEAVGQSIVLSIAILAPLIAVLYWMALRPLREFSIS